MPPLLPLTLFHFRVRFNFHPKLGPFLVSTPLPFKLVLLIAINLISPSLGKQRSNFTHLAILWPKFIFLLSSSRSSVAGWTALANGPTEPPAYLLSSQGPGSPSQRHSPSWQYPQPLQAFLDTAAGCSPHRCSPPWHRQVPLAQVPFPEQSPGHLSSLQSSPVQASSQTHSPIPHSPRELQSVGHRSPAACPACTRCHRCTGRSHTRPTGKLQGAVGPREQQFLPNQP